METLRDSALTSPQLPYPYYPTTVILTVSEEFLQDSTRTSPQLPYTNHCLASATASLLSYFHNYRTITTHPKVIPTVSEESLRDERAAVEEDRGQRHVPGELELQVKHIHQ